MGKCELAPKPQSASRRRGMLLEPTYGWGDEAPRKPTLREILIEWLDAINFLKDKSRFVIAGYFAFHMLTAVVFVCFLILYFSLRSLGVVLGITFFIANLYNQVWYHRYCTHRSFKFRRLLFPRIFLWTNPFCFREENWVVPHRIHHLQSDQPGDPYGPHLGWLGNYLTAESQQKMNRDITAQEYDRLAKTLEHIGFPRNSYEAYKRTGSVEPLWHYALRSFVATVFWCGLGWLIAGPAGAMAWISGVFFCTFVIRDFNYRGHGGFLFKASKGSPTNQIFYGLTGEWHDNHHKHPRSAREGLQWWQLDLPYWIIKAMSLCGVVVQINSFEGPKAQGSKSSVRIHPGRLIG
jgi:stearoyl-CoA desaturase (delta-9 desaturase)